MEPSVSLYSEEKQQEVYSQRRLTVSETALRQEYRTEEHLLGTVPSV